MAKNPIKKSDIIDDSVQKSINEFIASLEKLSQVFHEDVKEAADAVAKSLQGVNVTTKEGQETVAKASAATADLLNQQKQLTGVDKQLADARAKLTVLEKEGVQSKIKETAEIKKSISEKQKEITQGKAAADSYTALARKLKELRDAWKLAGESGRKELTPQIQKIDKQLKDLDKTIGQHQRNVGNYGSAIAGVGKNMLAAAGVTLGLSTAVKGFKAILDSTQATGDAFRAFLGGVGEGARYFAQRIATMDFTNLISGFRDAFREGKKYAEQLDLIGDLQRALGLQVIDIETEIARQRIIARDRRQDIKTREAAVEEIIKLEKKKLDETQRLAELALDNEVRNIQVRVDINKEAIVDFISNYEKYLTQITDGAALEEKLRRDAVVATKKQVFNARTEQMIEIETRKFSQMRYDELLANMTEEERQMIKIAELNNLVVDEQRDRLVATIAASKTAVKEQVAGEETLVLIRNRLYNELIKEEKNLTTELNKELDERQKAAKAQLESNSKAQAKAIAEQGKNANMELIADAENTRFALKEIKQQEVEDTKEARQAETDFIKEMNREILRDSVAAAEDSMQAISDASAAIGDIMAAQKQRELNAAGDNAEKREEIERKYFEREKALAITQAIINGALAITKVQAQTGILSPFSIPLIIASTLGQIAVIAAQKFAKGGYTGDGSMRDETGERVAGIVHEKEFVIDKHNTKKYRPVLEAIHRDDPHGIATAMNGQYYDLWDRANNSIEIGQDPFTQKMYELMSRQPVIYTDSKGSTVMRWPNGHTKVINKN